MPTTHHGATKVAHLDEPRLVRNLAAGDSAAAAELIDRVATDAWLLSVVVQQRVDPATDVSVRSVVRTLTAAAAGRLPPGVTFRAAALRATREASLAGRIAPADGTDLRDEDALCCYSQLDEPSRSALLLADIVLLPEDQLGHPLDLPDEDARALADRATAALRQRLARRLALPAAAEGEAQDVLVGATDQVRAALPPPPPQLDSEILTAWARHRAILGAAANGYTQPATGVVGRVAAAGPTARRAVAAAAAAVLIAGLIGVGSLADPPAAPPPTLRAGAATNAPRTVSAPPSTSPPTSAPSPAQTSVSADATQAAQLLQALANAGRTQAAATPAPPAQPVAAGRTSVGVRSTNVGSPTPANTAPTPTPAPVTAAPTTTAPSTTVAKAPAPTATVAKAPPPPPTTAAPAPTTTNPLQPVVDLIKKILHPGS